MNDVSIKDYFIHIKNSKKYLEYFSSNKKENSMSFNKDKKFFRVKKALKTKLKTKIKDETENCPICRNGDIIYPDHYDYLTRYLNCLICSTYTQNIKKSNIFMLYDLYDLYDHYDIGIDNNNNHIDNNIDNDSNPPFNYDINQRLYKIIIIDYCYICGEPINSCNTKINCKNKEHFEKHFENYHKKIIDFFMINLVYLLQLEKLHKLYEEKLYKLYGESIYYPCSLIKYYPDIVKMNVLAFHLKTNLFFIHNNNIFELVCEYLIDKDNYYYTLFHNHLLDSFKYCLENETKNLNFYFSDKYFTLNTP